MKPTWSVMIPAYHCNDFLPLCLRSVLTQAPGPQQMQIVVVNDDPGDEECGKVTAAVGGGRVEYQRNEKNLGAGGNFNRCLALATRDLVLILHGDCYLKDGFFEKLSALAAANPRTGLMACRAEGVDEQGVVNWVSHRYREFEAPSLDDSPIWESLHLMPSAVVVRREVYDRIGGFRTDIANGQDWEMWNRVIRTNGIIMSPEVLAGYRQHADSITGRTQRSAQNIREFARLYDLFAVERPGYPLERMRAGLRGMAFSQALEYQRRNDPEGAAANFRAWRELTPLPSRLLTYTKRAVKTLLGRA